MSAALLGLAIQRDVRRDFTRLRVSGKPPRQDFESLPTARFSARAPTFFFAAFGLSNSARSAENDSRSLLTGQIADLANIMSFEKSIGSPYTLASLPKPIKSSNGQVHVAGLCSLSGIKKRKRTEIAVGLDGEGVSIYSVRLNVPPSLDDTDSVEASKSSISYIVRASSKRILHNRTVFNFSKRKPQETLRAIYICIFGRIHFRRQGATHLLPRTNHRGPVQHEEICIYP